MGWICFVDVGVCVSYGWLVVGAIKRYDMVLYQTRTGDPLRVKEM